MSPKTILLLGSAGCQPAGVGCQPTIISGWVRAQNVSGKLPETAGWQPALPKPLFP